jgi:hypothetical protein
MATQPPHRPGRANRRHHERLPIDAAARLVEGTNSFEGRIENISTGGAAFITSTVEPELAVGAAVTIVAAGAGDDGGDLSLAGRIVRVDSMCDLSGDSLVYAVAFDQPIEMPADGDAASGD